MRHLFFLSLIVAFTSSCEVVLDVDVPEEDTKMVINSFLNPDSTISLDISEDDYILSEGSFTPVSGATITLLEDNSTPIEFEEMQNGMYRSTSSPKPGSSYTLTVSKAGFQDVTSTTTLPSSDMDVRFNGYKESFKSGYSQLELEIEINDPSEENHYEILVYNLYINEIYDSYYDEDLQIYVDTIIGYDSSYYLEYIETDNSDFEDDPTKWGQSILIDDGRFNGTTHTLKVYADYWNQYEDSYRIIEIRSCSKDYFDYVRSTVLQEWNDGDPFAQPVFVPNNIESGYGIFAGYSSMKFEQFIEATD